ncbi:RluA family pseudouridine synthase [Thalassobacillus sp. CUG 92003]|uniref:RluA family pseudouridine synthase n=1 Tax=Thalassobacillus sp. CUG 92003 TaxID=2736641 RepID=UPI0015E6DC92|nr:RluA family pseudouridine synthase [Thalassobacillus sp. CUG 92003]
MEMRKKGEWLDISVPKEWRGNTIEYILKTFWKTPRKLLHQIRMTKGVKLNGEVKPWHTVLSEGDRLHVHLFPPEPLGIEPQFIELDILYEDDHALVVNKPAGMRVHPTSEEQTDTLDHAVAFHFQTSGVEAKVRHVHRLDQDTTGAVLYAKHALAGAILGRLLEKKKIARTYVALVEGKVKQKSGLIRQPIGKDRHHATRRRVSSTGTMAVTHFQVLDYDPDHDLTLMHVQLETGKTHQIRVHMNHLGHPLLGDTLYGGDRDTTGHHALHAAKLTFLHPISYEEITCVAPFQEASQMFDYDLDHYLNS